MAESSLPSSSPRKTTSLMIAKKIQRDHGFLPLLGPLLAGQRTSSESSVPQLVTNDVEQYVRASYPAEKMRCFDRLLLLKEH